MGSSSLTEHLQKMKSENLQSPKSNAVKPPVLDRCICNGTGFYRVDVQSTQHPWFGQLFRCICRETIDAIALQEQIGSDVAPVFLRDVTAHTPDSEMMKEKARLFINGHIKSLTLYGNNGTGKTTTLMALTNEYHKKNVGALYLTAVDAMNWIKGGIGLDFGPDDRVAKLSGVAVLLLDELTQVNWTDYVREKIETILDNRYRNGTPIAMAMDQDPEDVLSARFSSRMKRGAYVEISDPDMRPVLSAADELEME